jgi:hypothetical protein
MVQSYDLRKMCGKHIAAGNMFVLHCKQWGIFGFIQIWNRKSFVMGKLHKMYTIIRLKETNRKQICQLLENQRLIVFKYSDVTVAILKRDEF